MRRAKTRSVHRLSRSCAVTIEDMHIMNDRKLVNFTVTEDDLKLQEEEIIPYWKNRAVREHLLKSYDPGMERLL